MSIVRVIRAGLLTTIQDLGRPGFRQFGVPTGGAMDRVSHELANRLVGNSPTAATLEMTLSGDELEFPDSTLLAITGGQFAPVTTDPEQLSIPHNRPVYVPAGTRIRFQTAQRGCRCYLAVAGGFSVPEVLGSRSTLLRAGFSGLQGRAIRAGDELPLGSRVNVGSDAAALNLKQHTAISFPGWFVRPMALPAGDVVMLRILPGEHFSMMSAESQMRFQEESYLITSQSDRMGYRLAATPLILNDTSDMLSEGTAVGTVQLPPDGRPILLMADSAPTGGYRRIAHVISADLPMAAQARPGQFLRFVQTTMENAQILFQKQRADLHQAITMAGLMPGAQTSARLAEPTGSAS